MAEKPLHVRVAEALGWTSLHHGGGAIEACPECCYRGDILLPETATGERWRGRAPGDVIVGLGRCHSQVPRYDLDWSATGPLIDKHSIGVGVHAGRYQAWVGEAPPPEATFWGGGDTAQEAICNLILCPSFVSRAQKDGVPPR